MQNDQILGTSAAITGAQSAMDILEARMQAANASNAQVQAANSGYMGDPSGYASAPHPAEGSFRSSFSGYAPDPDWATGRDWLEQQQQSRLREYQSASTAPPPSVDQWADRGNYGRADAQYGPWVEDTGWAGGRPGAPIEAAVSAARPSFSSYADALQARQDIVSDAREIYTASGRFKEIGGKGFNSEVEDAWESQGLFERPGFRERLMGNGGAFSLGYGAMQLSQEASRAYQTINSGDSLTEAQVTGAYAGVLPGALSLVGAIGGAAIPGVGPIIGGMGAGAVGTAIQGNVDAYTSRQDAFERGGDSLSIGRGGREAAEEFTTALKNISGAARDVTEVFVRMGQLGPVTSSGAAGIAPYQYEFGTAFTKTVSDEANFLASSPFLAPMQMRFGSNASAIPGGDFLGAAGIAAFSGDYGAMQTNVAFAQATAGRDVENPAWRRDSDFVSRYSKNAGAWQDVKDFFTLDGGQQAAYEAAQERLGNVGAGGRYVPGAESEARYLSRQDQEKAAQITNATRDLQAAYEGHQRNEADVQLSGAQMGADLSGLQVSLLRGGGAASINAALPGIQAEYQASAAAIGRDITGLRNVERTSPTLAPYAETMIQQEASRRNALAGQEAQISRLAFTTGLQEEESGYDLTTLRARLEGRAPSEIADQQRRQARYLENVQGPISPSERNALTGQAVQLRYSAAQEEYGQEEGTVNLGVARASAGVQMASGGGTPSQVYQAQIEYAKELTTLQQQYNSEVERGNLTWEQANEKRREAVRLGGEINNAQDQARVSYFASVGAMDDANTGAVRAGLSRNVEIQGNSAYGAMTGVNAAAVADARQAVAAAPPGTVEQRRAIERLSVLQAQGADNETDRQTYSPDIASATRLSRDSSAFRVAMDAPYMDGPDSNPLTRGNALLGDLQSQRAQAQADLRSSTDPIAIRRNTAIVGQFDEQIAGLEREKMTGLFRALPSAIEGGTNDGYGVYAQTPYAMAAALGGGNPTVGSIGRPNFGVPTPQANVSAMAGFMGASGMGTGSRLEQILDKLADAIAGRGSGGLGVNPAPMGSNFGTLRNDIKRQYDTSRPYDHLTP